MTALTLAALNKYVFTVRAVAIAAAADQPFGSWTGDDPSSWLLSGVIVMLMHGLFAANAAQATQ